MVMDTDDFFKILCQKGIRKKDTRIDRLAQLLQPSQAIENFVALSKLENIFTLMQAN